jgi:hypothetical protein
MDLSHASVATDANLQHLIDIITDLSDHRLRRRRWGDQQGFACLLALTAPGARSSYTSAIAWVHACAGHRFGWPEHQEPDPSGLARSRALLSVASCADMERLVRSWALTRMPSINPCISGHTLVAIDGSMLHMPATPAIRQVFPRRTDKLGIEIEHYPQARLLMAWDAERHMPCAWRLTAQSEGERESAGHLLSQLPDDAIAVMDRGFPSRALLGLILASGRHAIVRMVASEAAAFPEVREFLASGRRSAVVACRIEIDDKETIVSVKLVRRRFRRGRPTKHEKRELMVILSTLTDIEDERLIEIYGMRWGVETAFREMKSIAAMERWHSTTPDGIRQELHALMCWFCIAGLIAISAEAQDQASPRHRRKRVNTAVVMKAIASILAALYAAHHDRADPAGAATYIRQADAALLRVLRRMQRRRPGRHNSRTPAHPYARRIA